MNTPWIRTLLPAAVLCGLAFLPPASQAAEATENRSVGEFNAIALGGAMNLTVRQGSPASVQVSADDKLLPQIETVVESGRSGPTLQLRMKREQGGFSSWSSRGAIKVTVVTPQLSGLSTAGSGDIRLEAFKTPALQLSIAGAGNAVLNGLDTEELGVGISGSGDVRGDGRAARLNVSIAGSGDVRLADLRGDEVSVKIAGSGDAAVNAQKTLKVSIAGSGDVIYTGEATVKSSVAGSGSIKKR